MRFACDSCGAQYMIADEKVGARGVKVKCKKCSHMIVVKPAPVKPLIDDDDDETVVAPFGLSSFGMDRPTPAQQSEHGESHVPARQSEHGESQAPAQQSEHGGESQAPAQQSELGGAFNAMFGSSDAPTGEIQPPESQHESHDNGHGENAPEGNSAFGFQSGFGAASNGETDMALGALEQHAQAPSADRAGERTWYVAIEDAQVGPINLAEVEERWDSGEIDEDTLVWKAGMADWVPLVDVSELAYLITERPHVSRGAARPAMGATAGASMSSASGLSAASYGGPQEMTDEPSWKPSAASALSSLVQEELVAKKPEPREEHIAAPKGMEGLGIGTSDIFGSGSGAGTPITMGQPAPEPKPDRTDPFAAGGSPAWSVPSARRSSSGLGLKVLLGTLAVAVLGLGTAMAYMFSRPSTQKEVVREIIVQQAPQPAPPPIDPNAPPPAPPVPPAPPPVAKVEPPRHARVDETRERPDVTPQPRPGAKKPKDESSNPDSLFEAPKAAPVASAPAIKEKLEKDDIIEGVKANGSKLGPCVTAARSKDEIQPGRVQFVLDWTINPNGSVTAARLKGPPEVMNTSLPSCFARVMGSWKFAASKNGAPISNFPLPITVH